MNRYKVGEFYIIEDQLLFALYQVTYSNDRVVDGRYISVARGFSSGKTGNSVSFTVESMFDHASRLVTKEEATEWMIKYS